MSANPDKGETIHPGRGKLGLSESAPHCAMTPNKTPLTPRAAREYVLTAYLEMGEINYTPENVTAATMILCTAVGMNYEETSQGDLKQLAHGSAKLALRDSSSVVGLSHTNWAIKSLNVRLREKQQWR